MLQVSAALEVLPLCQLKPFMKGVWMHKLVLSRHPFVWGLSRGFLAFQTRLIFLLATETSFIVTAETHETIPDSLRTLLFEQSGCCLFQHLEDELWASKFRSHQARNHVCQW